MYEKLRKFRELIRDKSLLEEFDKLFLENEANPVTGNIPAQYEPPIKRDHHNPEIN